MDRLNVRMLLITVLFCGTGLLASCTRTVISSDWDAGKIKVDGSQQDWQGNLRFVKSGEIGLGIANNADTLYYCAVTANQQIMREIVARGLTIWLDPNGGKAKTFGIRYPIGLNPSTERRTGTYRSFRRQRGIPDLGEILKQEVFEFELFEPDSTNTQAKTRNGLPVPLRLPTHKNRQGIELQMKLTGDMLIYEASIPLDDLPPATKRAAIAKKLIGIGVETTRMGAFRPRSRGGFSGGFGGGNRGGRPGGMTGGFPRNRGQNFRSMSIPSPLEFWGTVRLAAPPRS